ncbi:MAG: hypothetical protein C4335_08965 [Armatimonadota bacterium]
MSEQAAYAYRAAPDHLLGENSHRLVNQKVVYWYSQTTTPEDDPIAILLGESQIQQEVSALEQIRRLLESVWRGERATLLDARYYVLTLSGSGGRVMVRDWVEGDFRELVQNVNAWFDDLSIVHRDGKRLADPPKFLAVARALARKTKKKDERKDVPAPMLTKLLHSALKKEPIPRDVMAQTLARVKADIVQDERRDKQRAKQDEPFNHARMGLLKAYLIRQGGKDMQAHLNPNHPSPAYHCGKLMAVLADLQRAALPDVEAGIVQRFYAAASATPALVLGRIVRTAQFHIDKVRADSAGLAAWYESRIAEIMSAIGDTMPRTLILEEQSLFALGYYQQLAHHRAGKSHDKEEQTNE